MKHNLPASVDCKNGDVSHEKTNLKESYKVNSSNENNVTEYADTQCKLQYKQRNDYVGYFKENSSPFMFCDMN